MQHVNTESDAVDAFKVLDESKMKKHDDLWEAFQDVGSTRKLVKLKQFHKFDDTAEAVQSATALVEGRLSAGMKKFLKKLHRKLKS